MPALRRFLAAALGFVVLTMVCSTDHSTKPATPRSIIGEISDAVTSAPMSGVSVSTQSVTSSVMTDARGRYSIMGVQAGSCAVNASRTGYAGVVSVSVVTGSSRSPTSRMTLRGLG